ncbi:MAG: hypothetical protein EXQ93_05380 [Alphaproteobacteria bacterium]|nr:hypothetical protein [Alphaproteobacteria bacterium]
MLGPLPPPSGLPAAAPSPTPGARSAWGADGFSFRDVLDVLNPLQHIPVVSWAYRAITGDGIAPTAKVLGGGLFGGMLGFAMGAADAALQELTGRDTGQTALALLGGKRGNRQSAPEPSPEPAVLVAAATAPPHADVPALSGGPVRPNRRRLW